MILTVNMLIGWLPDPPEALLVERILWLDPLGNDLASIDIQSATALPVLRRTDQVLADLHTGRAQVVDEDTVALQLVRADVAIPLAHRTIRDARWSLIAPLVALPAPTLLFAATRAHALTCYKQTWWAEQGETSSMQPKSWRRQVLDCLRRYWQRGQVINALLPDFAHCGGRGKERGIRSGSKRGRDSKRVHQQPDHSFIGVNVTGQIREDLIDGFQRYYVRGNLPWHEAYDQTMDIHFRTIVLGEDGKPILKLLPKDERPTIGQFMYWGRKAQDLAKTLQHRQGQRNYDLHHRPLTGDTAEVLGPGSLVQEDATIGDTYLVSEFDRRRIIGRPVIYVLIDVFSRLIVGLAISLDGPSWQGVMCAIENMASDKVNFCAEYGISITPADWPCHHLPETLMGDRGELFTGNANPLINSLGVPILNAAPYRADWKGVIERFFHLIKNQMTLTWLPGMAHVRERGEHDTRLDACLTLREFREIIIRCVIYYNTA
jgi:putative transposase